MYIRTRSTLTGLFAAGLFVAASWFMAGPVHTPQAMSQPTMLHIVIGDGIADISTPISDDRRELSQLRIAMPYFSFAPLRARKGVN